MYKIAIFCALFALSSVGRAETIDESLQRTESTWAKIYYQTQLDSKTERYQILLESTEQLVANYPNRAEPLIWQAIIIATNAEQQNSFAALEAIHKARNLLLKAIDINPQAMDGSAFVTLGSLYNMVPGWPIAFGDNDQAEAYLLTALEINPDGIDSNYFYGEYLLSQGQNQAAFEHFVKATQAPVRQEQIFADNQLKAEAALGLKNAQARKISGIKHFFTQLFDSATAQADN